ncbi:MAG TPA: DUF2889 domain-containing protein [Acidimicrobiia bacterium]|nr:DUF2889 domain-containing protein [Acidimicrobiia bacterium]
MDLIRPTDPRSAFPERATPSVRRVMHLDYDWIDAVDVHVIGAARDEVTDADGTLHIVHDAAVDVTTEQGMIRELAIEPAAFDVSPLLGQPLRLGFRGRVRPLYDAGGRPLGLLLDDLPGAMIAAGYVLAMERTIGPATPTDGMTLSSRDGDELPRGYHQADLCSGWRADGTMMTAVYAGEILPFEPVAPVPALPEGAGWPEVPIAVPGLRRHRRIDVVPDGREWRVDAWFRDTYRDSGGAHGSLHEYTVDLVVDARDRTVLDVRAIPHALPWSECPAAAEAVAKLVGQPVDGLRSAVPKVLQGIESCTHLTNELRELADLPALVASLTNAAG